MRLPALHATFAVLLVTSGFVVAGSAASGYSISPSPVVDTPDRDVTFDGETYEVSELGHVDPGNTVSATVSAPSGDEYNVYFYDADRDVLAQERDPSDDTVFFDVPEDDPYYPPGTYVLAVEHDGGFEAVAPVVISGYHVPSIDVTGGGVSSGDAPWSVEPGATVTVEASVSTVDDRKSIDRVRVVIGNDDVKREVTLTDGDGDDTYDATFDLDTLPEGDYRLYVVVQGSEQVLGRQEVLGVSDDSGFSIEAGGTTEGATETTTEDGGNTGSGGGTGGGGGSTGGSTAVSTSTSPPTTVGGTTASGSTTPGNVITPNDPSTTAAPTTTPGQPLGVLPALLALLVTAILALRRP